MKNLLFAIMFVLLLCAPVLAQSEQPTDVDSQIEPAIISQVTVLPVGNGRLTNALVARSSQPILVTALDSFVPIPGMTINFSTGQPGVVHITGFTKFGESFFRLALFLDGQIVREIDFDTAPVRLPVDFEYLGPINTGSHIIQLRIAAFPTGIANTPFGDRSLNVMTFN